MNILILSAGIRNKIVQYFKETLGNDGQVFATDMSEFAPAVYEADKFFKVPPVMEENYIDSLLLICRREKVDGIVSLMDDDLSLLAKNREQFQKVGTTVIGSSLELCERSIDKWEMYCWLKENKYKTAESYIDLGLFIKDYQKGKIDFPVFVKPTCGGGSQSIAKVNDLKTLQQIFEKAQEQLMIQQFMDGCEIGADVYIDILSKEVVSIFTKEKLVMRSGETNKSVSIKDPALFALIEDFVLKSGYLGQIDIDVFRVDGEYYISEVNPRFGGGYPHAYECGCNHMKCIINNLNGIANEKCIGNYDENYYMMKYNEVMIRKIEK